MTIANTAICKYRFGTILIPRAARMMKASVAQIVYFARKNGVTKYEAINGRSVGLASQIKRKQIFSFRLRGNELPSSLTSGV